MSSRIGSIVFLVLLGAFLPAPGAQAERTPCPGGESGFVLWNVATEPYTVDNLADAAGNGNGWVCARELPGTFVEDGVEYHVQNFIDDRL